MKNLSSLLTISIAGSMLAPAAITDSLVAYWDFEGGTANHASASGGAAYNGVLQGNAAIAGGAVKVGTGSLVLDGVGDYLDVTSIVDPNQPWSVSAWYRADLAPTTRFMVFETSGSFPMSFGLREGSNTANTNHQAFADVVPGTDTSADFQLADTATATTWHQVVLASIPATSEAAGSITIYIDGVLRNTMVIPAGNTLGSANGFHIGTYRTANDRWFDGAIDEVAIWNRTLSGAEALETFQRGEQGETLTSVKYHIALSASPTTGGTVTGSGLYSAGASVPIVASPGPGYIFAGWSDGFTGQPASFTYVASASVAASATFAEDTADTDGDGLTNYEEAVVYQTQPNNADSDGDEIPDGDEVTITGTNPTSSDALLVNFVRNNLSPNQAGVIALSSPRIERNPLNGQIGLFLSLSGTAGQGPLQPINLSSPSASVTPSGDGWNLSFPAPSNTVNSYILRTTNR